MNAGALVIVATAQLTGYAMMKSWLGVTVLLPKIRTFASKSANFLKLPDVV